MKKKKLERALKMKLTEFNTEEGEFITKVEKESVTGIV